MNTRRIGVPTKLTDFASFNLSLTGSISCWFPRGRRFTMILEIRSAARSLVRSRFVSILAIVAFALGIGITTAVFSIFNGVLLQPLPYPHPEQLVAVYGTQPTCPTCPASFPKYHDWKTRNNVFSAMGGSTQASFAMTGQGDPARVSGMA